jgi:hypothetical protein
LGIRANLTQFTLLVIVNTFDGAMADMEALPGTAGSCLTATKTEYLPKTRRLPEWSPKASPHKQIISTV